MKNSQTEHYVTVQELEEDLAVLTGNPQLAKAQAKQFSIRYQGEVIDAARYKKGLISKDDLLLSRHVRWQHTKNHSKRLAENMASAGRKRPTNAAAHHIVAWNHPRAARARLRLAAFGIDIDHEANGVYLPRFKKHIPHKAMPNANAHSVVHTGQYYLNVEFLIQDTIAEGLGKQGIIDTLREIGEELESGTFPLTQSI